MVLAAGLGKRMRPITDTIPKPLVPVAGRTLLDWGLDSLAGAGVVKAVVNVHYFPEQIAAHVASRAAPRIVISDESGGLLDSAGGIVKALPELGHEPFYIINADTFWIDRGQPNLARLALAWDPAKMDILLMLADLEFRDRPQRRHRFPRQRPTGALRRSGGDPRGLIYAGAAIVHPRIFAGAPPGPLSLNRYFDAAIAEGRLFGMQDGRPLDHRRHARRHPARRGGRRAGIGRRTMSGLTAPRVFSIPPGVAVSSDAGRGAAVGSAGPGFSPSTATRWRWPTSPSTCRRAAPRASCAASSSNGRRAARRSCR